MFRFLRRRLYLQIYLTCVGIIFLLACFWGVGFAVFKDDLHARQTQFGATIAQALLPPANAPIEVLRDSLSDLHISLNTQVTVLGPDGKMLAFAGEPVKQFRHAKPDEGWVRFRHGYWVAGVPLDDGRWVLIRQRRDDGEKWLWGLLAMALSIGLGAYPIARRITRRLERLGQQVEALGAGDLTARVEVDGVDEVADVARSFNRAAERISQLVNGQRAMLSGASHELRTPLTRMRMALELMDTGDRAALGDQMRDDIDELDALIEELLTASRLELGSENIVVEELDLLALAAEEAARTSAQVNGTSTPYVGERRWLARAIRNLLENAKKYGGAEVLVSVTPDLDGGALVVVEDNGSGVPEDLRKLVFQPFFRLPGMREGHDRGVGLGLALVRQICERHNADVVCLERVGGGSRFELKFPPLGGP
jgi:signal transduction histidine kinase